MKKCRSRGNNVNDFKKNCTRCGEMMPFDKSDEKINYLYFIPAVTLPVAGIIMWLAMHKVYPKNAKICVFCSICNFAFIAVWLLFYLLNYWLVGT